MKRLLISDSAPTKVHTTDKSDNKNSFSALDLADILNQIDELKNYHVAIKTEDGCLLLAVGDSRYEISKPKNNCYPRRTLRKLDT